MKLQPLFDKVVIEPIEKPTTTKAGLHLPEASREKPQTGIVIAVGEGLGAPLSVKVGDTVFFSSFIGTEFSFDEKKYLIMTESSILAIVKA